MLLTALVGFSFALGPVTLTRGDKNDPYYQMDSANLNTMNSYFIPNTVVPEEVVFPVDNPVTVAIESYENLNTEIVIGNNTLLFHVMSSYIGVLLVIAVILLLAYLVVKKKKTWFAILFTDMFEWIYKFFEDLLGEDKPARVKNYVTTLFFVILFANLLWLFSDVIRFIFPRWLRNVTTPTAELEFNVALAITSVVISLIIQIRTVWFRAFLHEYVPITGKWLIEGDGIGTKIGDIVVSMFVGFLDIVGTFAKVISLSMRLFGNMSSGSILLNIAFLGFGGIFVAVFGTNFPVILPIIVYVQGLLVACVQAFVFSMLSAIFIKMVSN